jgi:4-hydroxy-3-polyprenylbenzoate decarboxylase
MQNLIIAVTGASGSIYALKALEILAKQPNINTHLITSPAAHITLKQELDISVKKLNDLADYNLKYTNIGANIASGSFINMGMIILPCSVKTMSEIATGNSNNLISRAADVALKEKRKLLICLRETPLHSIHLDNMKKLSDAGAIIFPPVPAFYLKPKSLDEMVGHTVGRILNMFNINSDFTKEWQGLKTNSD